MLLRTLLLSSVCGAAFASTADIVVWNHIGYERLGPKTAIVKNPGGSVATDSFELLDGSGTSVYKGAASTQSLVSGWGSTGWKVLDFSAFQDSGDFFLRALPGKQATDKFSVRDQALLRGTGASIVSFFNAMRSTDDGDRTIGYYDQSSRGTHDVHGGWKDATGDDGKYISHLSYADYMNPQQIPMVVWSLLRSDLLAPRASFAWNSALLSEAAWGADYLLRIQDPAGYFYINVFRAHWSAANPKLICAWVGDSASQGTQTTDYQAAWREGGGMSIAALALAARTGISGDSSSAQYLAAAVRGYDHLSASRGRWADDGRENLIDHYCALIASVELALATGNSRYADSAGVRVDSIVARQQSDGWFVADNGVRPFYHGVDEGLPLVALWAYLGLDSTSDRAVRARAALAKSVQWYRSLTRGVANPFVYPRMYAPDTAVYSVSSSASGGVNLARTATATATSTQGSGYPASNVVDGSVTTRWSSVLNDSSATLTLDLGAVASIDSVSIDWEAAYAKKYALQISKDGSTWSTVYDGGATASGWDGHSVGGDSARYVRMRGKAPQYTYYGYSIYEFQVFGTVQKTAATAVAASKRFFMPHRNETQYWWQGENARLGSMSTALLLAGRAISSGWTLGTDSLSQEGIAGLDWVLGKNSAGVDFLYGVKDSGYTAYNGGSNLVGGICNGIAPLSDADQAPIFYDNDGGGFSYPYQYWHWTEQWLPHDSWFLLGVASAAHLQEVAPDVGVRRVALGRSGITVVAGSGLLRASAASSSDWTLRDPSGRVFARAVGVSAEFAPGRGTWIVEALAADGIRQSRMAVLP